MHSSHDFEQLLAPPFPFTSQSGFNFFESKTIEMSFQEHCGFIGLIGRPNVGKSTLLNKLIGQDLSITTPKPQTTRNRLIGIRTQGASQMVFIDTPGIHESNLPLNRKMIDYAVKTLEETDLNLWLVEPLKPHLKEPHPDDKKILDLIRNSNNKTILVINKMDLADRAKVLRTIDLFSQNGSFAEIIPLSALKSTNLESLLVQLEQYLPEHPFFFESDQLTAHKNLVEYDGEALMLHFTILDFRRSQCIQVMISNKYLPHLFLLLLDQDLFILNRTS